MLDLVISGGQTGVDQAALRAARRCGIRTGGWAPMGWRTLDGPREELLRSLGLREYHVAGYAARTAANVRTSSATLRIAANFRSPGELCTANAIARYQAPRMDVRYPFVVDPAAVARWIAEGRYGVLNVAGNAEATAPGIGAAAEGFLVAVFGVVVGRG